MKEKRTYQADDDLLKYGFKVPNTEEINPEFYNYVMDEVDENAKGIDLALQIYDSLNKKVSYDEQFMAFRKDYDFLQNKNIKDITSNNSSVICDTWALLYASILEKNGIPAVVNKAVAHSKVYFSADGYIVSADATENQKDPEDESELSDITRCKMGMNPYNFFLYEKDETGQIKECRIDESTYIKENNIKLKRTNFSSYITKLINLLNENSTYKKYNNSIKPDILDIINEIKFQLEQSNLDTISNMLYLNNLLKMLVPKDDLDKLTKDYIKIKQDNEIKYGVILNYCPYEVEFPRCYDFHPPVDGINFLYTSKTGLCKISEDKAYRLQEENDDIELNPDDYIMNQRGGK